MKFQGIFFKIFSSIYKRIHSWGVFSLLVMLYLSSAGLRSTLALYLFGRLGLMTAHIFCGFFLFLVFLVLAHKTIINSNFFIRNRVDDENQRSLFSNPARGMGIIRIYVDLFFHFTLLFVCCLGLVYYFVQTCSINSILLNLTTISLFHSIAGWFFLSLAFVKYYLTIVHWFREVFAYLREY